jgi:two-component system chemotaxis response regulator CheY
MSRSRFAERRGRDAAGTTARTIVVVDDDDDISAVLKDILEEEGYAVAVAGNGIEAMALVKELPRPPCLVILDLSMPWMGGKAVYAALQADPALAQIPVVVSTSHPSGAPSGVVVMRKPVDLAVLLATVRENCA